MPNFTPATNNTTTTAMAAILPQTRMLRHFLKKSPVFIFNVCFPAKIHKKQKEAKHYFTSFCFPCEFLQKKRLLTVVLIRNSQLLATLCTTRREYTTPVLCCHSFTEAVLVHSSSVVRLKCSFHCCLFYFIIICFHTLGCKITYFFLNNQELSVFSGLFYVFLQNYSNFAACKSPT